MKRSDKEALGDYELMECIERGLNRFGASVKYAIMWRMVVMGEAPKEGILVKPEAFSAALQSIFGVSGMLVERAVLDEVKVCVDAEKYGGFEKLTDLINAVRRQNVLDQIVTL
jgi:triphosphoribosyl-dephospho-CoA synthetase